MATRQSLSQKVRAQAEAEAAEKRAEAHARFEARMAARDTVVDVLLSQGYKLVKDEVFAGIRWVTLDNGNGVFVNLKIES